MDEERVMTHLRIVEMVAGLVVTGYMVWMLCPPLRVWLHTQRLQLTAPWRAEKERQRVQGEMMRDTVQLVVLGEVPADWKAEAA